MPIYAYKCASCGHAKDVLQKISDAPLTVCPACGEPAFTKQVTAAGFQLKGSGWYVTDFRSGSGKSPEKTGETAGDKAADKSVDKSADTSASKPADKPAEGAKSESKPKPADTPKSGGNTPSASAGGCGLTRAGH